MHHEFTNALINETSPYLLQHAHNPVNWEAWNYDVLKKAKEENKLLIISIGYASCHWCHVMEEECFEDKEVAAVMNKNFINIKIDREERPDIDHIYMDALQMMTGQGGWPLNIVALPDGKPFWGGTYLPKKQWMEVLQQLSDLYTNEPDKIIEHAEKLSEGIKAINLVESSIETSYTTQTQIDSAVQKWSGYFDTYLGGYKRAPKFMMPTNLNFLLHYAYNEKNDSILEYVNTTLTRMAYGGVFDHVGGGFSRYAVDTKWHVPHFEKMLYDNGQLTSLYAKAFAYTKNPLYKEVVDQTIQFVERDLMNDDYGFYSSLDADSLNDKGTLEEGAFYVWTEAELQRILGTDFPIFKDYYNINSYGLWEHENYVLIRDKDALEIASTHQTTATEVKAIIKKATEKLFKIRAERPAPRLDDKILTSWNALMLKGLTDAYRYTNNKKYKDLALKNAAFIKESLLKKDGSLYRNHKDGKSTLSGYLEDYATLIDAFIGVYEITFEEEWLSKAKALSTYCLTHFYDKDSKLFFFTADTDPYIIRRTLETGDNVIPASNSIMAKNLFKLQGFYPDSNYGELATQMLVNIQDNFKDHPQNYANWLDVALLHNKPFYEIAVVGEQFSDMGHSIRQEYLPNTVLAGTAKNSALEILKNRNVEGETYVYVCEKGSCKIPQTSFKEVLKQVQDTPKD